MPLKPSDKHQHLLDQFGNLSGYEKGVVARAFLKSLVRQGSLEAAPTDKTPGEIFISVERWQLDLLARFSNDVEHAEPEDDQEIVLDELCLIR